MAQTTQPPTDQKKLSAAERRAARAAEVKRERQRRQRRTLGLAIVGAAVLALAAFFFLRGQAASQVGAQVADEGQGHVNEGSPLTYRHYPPSSGVHYGVAQPAGISREEVPEGRWVHSLEHGYIVVLLKCADGCPDAYQQLDDLYRNGLPKSKFGNVKFVVTPYSKPFSDPSKEAPITLVAWNHELMLQSFDRDKIIQFYKKYVDGGPEGKLVQ